jgi:branched-chain amino acid transport system ATP-binding protein
MNTLVADSVVAGYGKQEIVHSVSLVAEAGKITCIFGPNGCGKSTAKRSAICRSMKSCARAWC